jgi:crotonobetainyl-CoA:carnitine CoA-transferase CaiB-like acyl-CoA transferase
MTTQSRTNGGPLQGIRVLDMTRVAAGPYCTMLLADLGATVLKIEREGVGDDTRRMDISVRGEVSGYYLGLNKNKRSIALDLKSSDAGEIVRALATWADVFVENFRLGAVERLGFGYEALCEINPRLVYCSISAFGSRGPKRDWIGYDIIGQAMSGIMDITGEPDRPPAKAGAPVADISSGAFAAVGILAALLERERSGVGQKVETSLIGSAVNLIAPYVSSRALGTTFDRVGSGHNTLAPYQAFRGSDGRYFILAVGNDSFWQMTAAAIGAPELAADASLASNAQRIARREELATRLQKTFDGDEAESWVSLLRNAGVPVSPIFTVDDVIAEPHFREAGFITEVEHPTVGSVPVTVTPLEFSRTNLAVHEAPPMLDQHGDEIRELARSLGAVLSTPAGR